MSKFKRFWPILMAAAMMTTSLAGCTGEGIQGEKGEQGEQGAQGEKGEVGATGANGQDGVSIVDSYVDDELHLWVILSDGTKKDAGYVGTNDPGGEYSEGLAFRLSQSGDGYFVRGLGICADNDVHIPASYSKKPVTGVGEAAFYNCNYLTNIVIPDSVTDIDDEAFYGCSSLKNVTISNSVTAIGNAVFHGCSALESVVVPNGVIGIGNSTFYGCSGLKSVDLPNSVVKINYYAFYGCTALTDINYDGTMEQWKAVEKVAGWNTNTGLIIVHCTDGDVDESKWIPEGGDLLAFTWNSDGTGYSVAGIGSCSDTDIVIPLEYNGKPVTGIEGYAFSWKDRLTSITIQENVTSIGEGAFYGCSGLTSITIPDSVTSIGSRAFNDTAYYNDASNWTDGILYIGSALIECETDKAGAVSIKEGTTCVASWAFYDCTGLTSITLPNSVTSIGEGAFGWCQSLTSITIPNSVTSIGDCAFESCRNLKSITIPDSVTSIGEEVFSWCYDLTSITVVEGNPNYHSDGNCLIETLSKTVIAGCVNSVIPTDGSVTNIGNYAFSGCSGPTSIVIPDSVTSIGDHAFHSCYNLRRITIPNSVTSIGEYAFDWCQSLTSITIPNSVTSIGGQAFCGCSGLTSITVAEGNPAYHSDGNCLIETASKTLIQGCNSSIIPTDGSVTNIGDEAFYGCSELTSITISDSVTSIGEQAFSGCSNLNSIIVAEGNPVYHSDGNCLIETSGKTLIVGCRNSIIPADGSVTCIGDGAFYNCWNLMSITIPDGVTSIGEEAFWQCTRLTSITIPNSVTSIGWGAFIYCYDLTNINYSGTMEQWEAISKRGNITTVEYTIHCTDGDIARSDS